MIGSSGASTQPGEPLERVGDPRFLGRELCQVPEILEPATAAGREVRARRRHPVGPGTQHFGRDRLRMPALHLRDAGADGVARQPAAHEDDEAVEPRDAVAAERERVDGELELLVSLDGGGHGPPRLPGYPTPDFAQAGSPPARCVMQRRYSPRAFGFGSRSKIEPGLLS